MLLFSLCSRLLKQINKGRWWLSFDKKVNQYPKLILRVTILTYHHQSLLTIWMCIQYKKIQHKQKYVEKVWVCSLLIHIQQQTKDTRPHKMAFVNQTIDWTNKKVATQKVKCTIILHIVSSTRIPNISFFINELWFVADDKD